MSIAKRPGVTTRQKAKVLEEFERYAEDATSDEVSDDATTNDNHSTLENQQDDAMGSGGEDFSGE